MGLAQDDTEADAHSTGGTQDEQGPPVEKYEMGEMVQFCPQNVVCDDIMAGLLITCRFFLFGELLFLCCCGAMVTMNIGAGVEASAVPSSADMEAQWTF